MPRRGGLLGAARDRLLEALVDPETETAAETEIETEPSGSPTDAGGSRAGGGGRLLESELRSTRALLRRLGRIALNTVDRGPMQGQDDAPESRIATARRVREVAGKDSQMLYAVRLRNAFCFGEGVPEPRAPDEDLQELLTDLWEEPANQAEITTPEAQWRTGADLWKNANVYFVVFAGLSELEQGQGLDGRVIIGSLQHDLVKSVVRDPRVWSRVLYYVVTEFVYEYDYEKAAPKPNPTKRTVYYEAFEGMAALRREVEDGRPVPDLPPRDKVRPGQVVHVALNRGKESAFGDPEMRTNLRWAAAVADLLAGQVEKARAAQRYLLKLNARGARDQRQLTDLAMTAVAPGSPLASADLDGEDPDGRSQLGGALVGNGAIDAQPFSLDSGAANAKADIEMAGAMFATGTNFGPHYYIGSPGSLAGSQTLELPVLKLTQVDQKLVEQLLRKFCDLRIERARAVGILSDRRAPTEEELERGAEVDGDGLVERDFSYELSMPDPLRRNLPELMGLVSDGIASFDPTLQNKPFKRALLGYYLTDLVDMSDGPALLDAIMAADEEQAAEAMAQAQAEQEALAAGGDQTFTGPDGQQHTSQNAYGARTSSQPVVEAAVEDVLRSLARRALEARPELAAANGHVEP